MGRGDVQPVYHDKRTTRSQPIATEAFTVRTDGETAHRLDALASRLDRSRNYLLNQAIKDHIAVHAWQIKKTRN
jgi:predicted transcriptional regulator